MTDGDDASSPSPGRPTANTRGPRVVPAIVLLVLVAAVPIGAPPASADGFVSVSATLTPTDPVPEEPFTVAANLTIAEDGESTYIVDGIALREGPEKDDTLVERRDERIRMVPGTDRTLEINATINETGVHTVFVHLTLRDEDDDERRIVTPLTVEVYQPHPQVDVSTDASTPGDEQILTVTVSNGLEEAIRNVELVVDGPSIDARNPRRVVASIEGGGNHAFEFRVTPDSEAVHNVSTSIRYTHADERRRATRTLPTDFSVSPGTSEHPQVSVSAESAAPGEPRRLTVTLSNGLSGSVRNVELLLDGERFGVNDPRRVTPVVEAGASQSFGFTATPREAAPLPVDVRVRYTLDGVRRSVTSTLTADFTVGDGPAERPQIEVAAEDAIPGARRSVNVTVANGLERDLRQLTVLVESPAVNLSATERVRARLAAGETATFRFPARVGAVGTYPLTTTLVYTDEDIRQRVTRTVETRFDAPASPGEITLTDVRAVQRGDSLEVSATASNVGSGPVEAVVVSVADAPAVSDADYFVGGVEGSDFATFTLSTGTSGNVSTVPLTVTYVVDGVRRSATVEIPVERAAVERPDAGRGGLPLVPIAGLVVLLVALVVASRWRG